ncbi:hypothetical protein AACH06_24020 [Ideonella sp. DXS29W]|uniref:Transcription factor zinc-finger domain-containing protein n=1 Tax=Ideonella lacteola TaxID=2984193 RepID=A0ABU9BVY0_9BURK
MSTAKDSPRPCPRCGSTDVTAGSLLASDDDNVFKGRFYPAGLAFFALSRSVAIDTTQGFMACTGCGCVWNQVDPQQLRQVLTRRRSGESPFAPGVPHKAKWWLLAALAALLVGAVVGLSRLLPG